MLYRDMGGIRPFIILMVSALVISAQENDTDRIQSMIYPKILVCVLARNKAHTLPYFLGYLEELDYPKDRLHLYIRSDHNIDQTTDILKKWTDQLVDFYGSIDYRSDADEANRPISFEGEMGPFDWPERRYQHIIDLKEEALSIGRRGDFDYVLFADADNFLTYTRILQRLIEQKKPIVAPMLRSTSMYSNFWAGMDEKGYYLRTDDYEPIYRREIQGCLPVPMIHSTFLIDLNDQDTVLLTFDRRKLISGGGDHPTDDVLSFERSARQAGIKFHLLNTHDFGILLEPRESYQNLEDDIENMRYLITETLFNGPPGLLHSPCLNPLDFLKPKTLEPGTFFDKVYLINLRRRPDRRRRMEWCLDFLGMNATLLEAVDGKKLTDSYVYDELGIHLMPEYRDPYHKRTMTHGEIGCFLSHYKIWEDVRLHKYKRVLVFEDDLRFVRYFRYTLSKLIEEADEQSVDWDLIYIGRKRLNPDNDGPMVPGCRFLSHVGYSYWTLSYALSYEGAVKLLESRPFENLVPIDEYLPIMFDRHPEAGWKSHFRNRNLLAFTAEPLLVFPTHYTGEPGYVSDTENAPLVDIKPNESVLGDSRGSRGAVDPMTRNGGPEPTPITKAQKRAEDEL